MLNSNQAFSLKHFLKGLLLERYQKVVRILIGTGLKGLSVICAE